MRTAHELCLGSFLVLALCAPAASASAPRAQQGAARAPQTLPSAREIIDRFNEVTHTKAMIETTKSVHVRGRMSIPAFEIEGPLEIWSAKPNLQLMQVDFGKQIGLNRSGHDGSVAWSIHPMSGGPKLREGVDLLQAKLEAAYDSSLKSPDLYESIKTVGRGTFEGKDCYQVEVVLKPLAGMDPVKTRSVRTRVEHYEVESGLLRGASGVQATDQGSAPYTQTASDYKKFGVQLVPTKSRIKVNGQEFAITIESVEFDTVDRKVFALPPEIRKLTAAKSPAKL